MRSYLFAILLCTVLFPLPSFGETMNDLVRRGGLYLEKPFAGIWGGNTPFTGKVTGREQGEIKDGLQEGPWVYYHENGKLSSKGVYRRGKRHGLWESFYSDGQLSQKGTYTNGQKDDGLWVRYWPNGNVFRKGTYKNGQMDGLHLQFHLSLDNEKILHIESRFKNGEQVGEYIVYHRNGRVESRTVYHAGQKNGPYVAFNSDGKLIAKKSFRNGKEDGPAYYYDNFLGSISRIGAYREGKEQGLWTEFYRNGWLRRKGPYLNGQMHGVWMIYHPSRAHATRAIYDFGRLVKREEFGPEDFWVRDKWDVYKGMAVYRSKPKGSRTLGVRAGTGDKCTNGQWVLSLFQDVIVYTDPNINSKILGTIDKDQKVCVIEGRGEWAKTFYGWVLNHRLSMFNN